MEALSVQNAQPSDQSSTLMLSKLLEVDSELADQAAQLMAQLESIEEKRKSLRTVISMFSSADNPTPVALEELKDKPDNGNGKEPEPVVENATEPTVETAPATAKTKRRSKAAPDTEPKKDKRKPSSSNGDKTDKSSNKTDKAAPATKPAKPGKRSPNWRQYLRAEFSQNSIPQAVSAVLQSQPEQVFDIATVVNTIFVDELPKETRSRAREVVSNTLSEGLRDKKWYRGKIGYYSLSRASAQKNMAS